MDKHPWNTDFEWQDHTGPYRIITDEQAALFDGEGFFVLEGALSSEQLVRTLEETDRYERKMEELLRQRDDQRMMIAEAGAITFTTHLVTRSPGLRELAGSDVFADLCHDLIGPDARLYWDQAVYKKPEKPRRFPWHQDNGYTYVQPQQYLTCWVALTDATEHNGCPQVASGLHRLGTLRHHYVDPLGWEIFEEPPAKAVAEVKAGGVVVFSSLTPHLTGPNTSDAVRKAYILQYAPDGARVMTGSPKEGPPTGEEPCVAPERQFPVLVGGVKPGG